MVYSFLIDKTREINKINEDLNPPLKEALACQITS